MILLKFIERQDLINLTKILKDIEESSTQLDEIILKIVGNYCLQLDNYIGVIGNILNDTTNPITDLELEGAIMAIPTMLYFLNSSSEAIGIREDVAKAIKLFRYNEVFIKTSGAAATKAKSAESAITEESLVHLCYQRAYKMIKNKVEAGYEVLNSVKKVLGKRMLELQLSDKSEMY